MLNILMNSFFLKNLIFLENCFFKVFGQQLIIVESFWAKFNLSLEKKPTVFGKMKHN